MIQNGNATGEYKLAGDMTPEEWRDLLPKTMSRYSEGCNNEAGRVLSDAGVGEVGVNAMGPNHSGLVPILNDSLRHLSQCVVTMLERCEDNKRVIKHFLPWFAPHYDCHIVRNPSKSGDSSELSAEAQREIISQNLVDEGAYRVAEALYEQQLKIVGESGL